MNKLIAVLLCLMALSAVGQKPNKDDVRLDIQPDPSGKSVLKWNITNNSKLAIYVYDFFLWGPGQWNEQKGDLTILGTAPSSQKATCPPNRVAPVLLLVVAPERTIQGDFVDDQVKLSAQAKVSMRIAVFDNPYSVVEKAKSFANSNCNHSPYDALV